MTDLSSLIERVEKGEERMKFTYHDLAYALENAAEFLENEEFPDGTGTQDAANKEAARRIRKSAAGIKSLHRAVPLRAYQEKA